MSIFKWLGCKIEQNRIIMFLSSQQQFLKTPLCHIKKKRKRFSRSRICSQSYEVMLENNCVHIKQLHSKEEIKIPFRNGKGRKLCLVSKHKWERLALLKITLNGTAWLTTHPNSSHFHWFLPQ